MDQYMSGDHGSEEAEEPPLTFTAYARRIGKSQPYVSKLVAEGRIAPPALTPERLILPKAADRMIRATADPGRSRAGSGRVASLIDYRSRKLAAEAERAEMELAAKRKELLPRTQVEAEVEHCARQIRDALMSLPRQVAERCARLADEGAIESLLQLEMRRVLTECHAELTASLGMRSDQAQG